MHQMTRRQHCFLFLIGRLNRLLSDQNHGISPTITAVLNEIRLASVLWKGGLQFDECLASALRRTWESVADGVSSSANLVRASELLVSSIRLGMRLFRELDDPKGTNPADFVAELARMGCDVRTIGYSRTDTAHDACNRDNNSFRGPLPSANRPAPRCRAADLVVP
jgi:hypothetical protein